MVTREEASEASQFNIESANIQHKRVENALDKQLAAAKRNYDSAKRAKSDTDIPPNSQM